MIADAKLDGISVLVVEDDFLLAGEEERALREAGARVIGPFAEESAALDAVASERPDCAVLDINLGRGASFAVPAALKAKGVPFVFVTGYDETVIPDEFRYVERLRKPVWFWQVVRAVSRLRSAT